jgi:hypothetical protein
MFNAEYIDQHAIPANSDALLDDECFDPAADDYLDRCLFELRSSVAEFRNL